MANRYAVASGNWSNVATWDGGTTLPGVGDTVRPNGYTVTIDQDVTVADLLNNAGGGAAANGGFSVTATRSITANLTAYAANLITVSAGSKTLTVVGSITGGSSHAIVLGDGNAVAVTGNVTGGASGNGINCPGGYISVTVVGNVTAGASGKAIYHYANTSGSPNPVTIVGAVTASAGATAIHLSASRTTLTITGTLTPSGSTPAVYIDQNYPVTIVVDGEITTDSQGFSAIRESTGIYGFTLVRLLIHPTNPQTHTYRVNNSGSPGVARSLYTGGQNLGQPVESDVREDTTFGVSNEYTGTLAVPPVGSVLLGVPTDDTVGTLVPSMSQADIRTAVGLAVANLDAQFAALPTLAEISAEFSTAAADVTVTVSATAVAQLAANDSGALRVVRGSTFRVQLTGMGSIANRTELHFFIKRRLSDSQDKAVIHVTEAAGLVRVNGNAAVDAGLASLTVDDAAAGDVTIVMEAELTEDLRDAVRYYGIKVIRSNGDADELIDSTDENVRCEIVDGAAMDVY